MNQQPTITPTPMDILPCPYSGCLSHEKPAPNNNACDVDWITDHWAQVVCVACNSRGPSRPTEAEAIAAWNEVAGLRKQLDELKELHEREVGTGWKAEPTIPPLDDRLIQWSILP